ncbi:hypothetical protein HJG60_009389 [Phyllostomus discolor]|uniref:Uncharacterized protein n=1 Tax=Phyllostomus discolor TaxID=89673 RepID=A0A833YGC7_9CHIR|nr:hypothetical protein HJG60_009389 [Phyllostomus discolor]
MMDRDLVELGCGVHEGEQQVRLKDEDMDLRRGGVIGLEGAQQISNPTHLTSELACLTRLWALFGSGGLSSSLGHLPVKASFFKRACDASASRPPGNSGSWKRADKAFHTLTAASPQTHSAPQPNSPASGKPHGTPCGSTP